MIGTISTTSFPSLQDHLFIVGLLITPNMLAAYSQPAHTMTKETKHRITIFWIINLLKVYFMIQDLSLIFVWYSLILPWIPMGQHDLKLFIAWFKHFGIAWSHQDPCVSPHRVSDQLNKCGMHCIENYANSHTKQTEHKNNRTQLTFCNPVHRPSMSYLSFTTDEWTGSNVLTFTCVD